MSKVRRIDAATDFGSYRTFTWDAGATEDFKRYNLLYGWNYSGKTTLSRMFAFLHQPQLPEGMSGGHFQATLEDQQGNHTSIDSRTHHTSLQVSVFNRDFVKANFQQEHNAPAVHILGENIKHLRDQITKRTVQVERQRKTIESLLNKKDLEKSTIDQKKTDCARTINAVIGGRYIRTHLDTQLPSIRANANASILDDATLESYKKTLATVGDYQNILEITTKPPNLPEFVTQVNILLGRTASNHAIDKIKNDSALENWLRTGLEIHKDRTICEFCGGSLQQELMNRLNGHFDREQEKLRKDIQAFLQEELPESFSIVIPDVGKLLPHLRQGYSIAKEPLQAWSDWCNDQLRTISQFLAEKLKTGLDQASALTIDTSRFAGWSTLIEPLNKTILDHETQIQNTDQLLSEARQKIEAHYIAQFCSEINLEQFDHHQSQLASRICKHEALITTCEQKSKEHEEEIRKHSIAAEKLNDLLLALLPHSNVKAVPKSEVTFEFQRNGHPAKNLSDGEKTAITFAYFLITLEDQGNKAEDTIVFVDDPISSLDSNHIYAVWSLINDRLKCCKQLFVSTHNCELFTLIKDEWVNSRQEQNFQTDHAGYWISRPSDPTGNAQSNLEKLPDLLRKYKSEYQFVYACLHEFANATSPSTHEAYTAPNLLRKFLEAYLGFRKPAGGSWHAKLDLLIDCPIKRKEINKFADDASHLQKPARITEHPTYISISQSLCKEVIDALKVKDHEHYISLSSLL